MTNLKDKENFEEFIESLNREQINSAKYSTFPFKTLTGISVSREALLLFKLLISFKMHEKWKFEVGQQERIAIIFEVGQRERIATGTHSNNIWMLPLF